MSEFDTRVGTLAAGPSPGQVRNAGAARSTDQKSAEKPRASTGVESTAAAIVAPRTTEGGAAQQVVSHDSGLSETLDRVASLLDDFVPNGGGNDGEAATSLEISQDGDTGRFIYKTVDDKTGEVVRQFPPEEVLNFITRFREAAGLLVDGKV
jgi:hypothetical protein